MKCLWRSSGSAGPAAAGSYPPTPTAGVRSRQPTVVVCLPEPAVVPATSVVSCWPVAPAAVPGMSAAASCWPMPVAEPAK